MNDKKEWPELLYIDTFGVLWGRHTDKAEWRMWSDNDIRKEYKEVYGVTEYYRNYTAYVKRIYFQHFRIVEDEYLV